MLVFALIFAVSMCGSVSMAAEYDSRDILKQGVVGAGTGAIAAGASGGKAGKGALIGAGTGILGSTLLDVLTQSPEKSPEPATQAYKEQAVGLYQEGYQQGFSDGYKTGYQDGLRAAQ